MSQFHFFWRECGHGAAKPGWGGCGLGIGTHGGRGNAQPGRGGRIGTPLLRCKSRAPRGLFALARHNSFLLIAKRQRGGLSPAAACQCGLGAPGGQGSRPDRHLGLKPALPSRTTTCTQATHRAAAPMYACRASAKWRARDPRACGIYLSCEVGLGRIKVDGCEGVC